MKIIPKFNQNINVNSSNNKNNSDMTFGLKLTNPEFVEDVITLGGGEKKLIGELGKKFAKRGENKKEIGKEIIKRARYILNSEDGIAGTGSVENGSIKLGSWFKDSPDKVLRLQSSSPQNFFYMMSRYFEGNELRDAIKQYHNSIL